MFATGRKSRSPDVGDGARCRSHHTRTAPNASADMLAESTGVGRQ